MKLDGILVYVVKTNKTLKWNILSSLENKKKKLTSEKQNDILIKLSLRQLIVLWKLNKAERQRLNLVFY